jgi:hypothetical protein
LPFDAYGVSYGVYASVVIPAHAGIQLCELLAVVPGTLGARFIAPAGGSDESDLYKKVSGNDFFTPSDPLLTHIA